MSPPVPDEWLASPTPPRDAVLFVEKDPANGRAVAAALRELGFALTAGQAGEMPALVPRVPGPPGLNARARAF